ncbi:MAG: SAM-dependent methyltransferase [Muribaculaceae bacterium]|nr:SAM-dependent methyltransferase [Muribaculaceae bacterium]
MITSALYLIPVNISEASLETVIPTGNIEVVREIRHFIVENVRTARRFLKKCDRSFDIDSAEFHELNRHTDLSEVSTWLDPLRKGEPMGVMSEAGCPAIADPGALAVEIAQKEGLRVVPLVGPSSILMALMASGFNGQGFAFNGYLPIDDKEKLKVLRDLESESQAKNRTQIFIETPYRNNKMVSFLSENLRQDTLVCVACDITDPEHESIKTLPASKWKNHKENYDKRPAIFLIYRGDQIEQRKGGKRNVR